MSESPRVPEALAQPLRLTLAWLTSHADFPRSRLPRKAETLLCMAAVAAAEEAGASAGGLAKSAMSYDRAALRQHAINRSHTQFKSDNSSKV